jgi:hypothetical protein
MDAIAQIDTPIHPIGALGRGGKDWEKPTD